LSFLPATAELGSQGSLVGSENLEDVARALRSARLGKEARDHVGLSRFVSSSQPYLIELYAGTCRGIIFILAAAESAVIGPLPDSCCALVVVVVRLDKSPVFCTHFTLAKHDSSDDA
jgi:hypothetical protein